MYSTPTGDRAKYLMIGSNTGHLSKKLKKLTQEAASGEAADLGFHLHGDTVQLTGLQNKIALIEQYKKNSTDASRLLDFKREVLNSVNDSTSDLSLRIRTLPVAHGPAAISELSEEATEVFVDTIHQLNKDIAGRFVFSGEKTDVQPLLPPSRIIDKLVNISAGSLDSAEVIAKVTDWFDSPEDGFVKFAYAGTLESEVTFAVADGKTADVGETAVTPEIRNLLKGLALAAISGHDEVTNGNVYESKRLLQSGAEEIWHNESALILKIAEIGARQEDVERGQTMNSSALATLTVARNNIRQVDLFETSSAIIETETQLRNLYLLTSRLSNLSLAEYLR